MIIFVLLFVASACIQPEEPEPISYIGHGAFFDQSGQQIAVTTEFVAKAQDWYRTKLLSSLSDEKKNEFAKLEEELNVSAMAEGQTRLVAQQSLLDWLLANSEEIGSDNRMIGKLNALQYELQWEIPEKADLQEYQFRNEFKLDPELENRLKLTEFDSSEISVLSATMNSGQAYIDECRAAGVPIPPPIGQMDPAGLTGWKSQGFIPTSEQFIVNTPAEVRTFQSSSPPGMCIALPRYTDATRSTVKLDGVICLGQASSNVCFWDNQMGGRGFNFARNTVIPIGVPNLSINPAGQYQAGGFELENGSGGVCTGCHAGQNPYIIHPFTDLGGGSGPLMDLNEPPLNLPTFAGSRYNPIIPASWPQNQLSHSPSLVPTACRGCHSASGPGGAFPHLSSQLREYCDNVLTPAINRTMPPGSPPGSQASNPDVIAFRAWCNSPASAGPSNRGDPHLTTTNGTNYDFQAAGEFIALRNSETLFELQTRQTPVTTSFIPGANSYTGLASCVSLNTAAAVRAGKYRITYQPMDDKLVNDEQLLLRIDGEVVDLSPEGFDLGDGTLVTRADENGGVDIRLWDGTRVIITPNFWESEGYWYLNVDVVNTPAREGTMGHILDGDWLPLAPDGSSFGPAPATLEERHELLNIKFADAWRVTEATSLFDYALDTSTDNFTNREWPSKPGEACTIVGTPDPSSKEIDSQFAKELCSPLKDEAVFENCVFDVMTTGDVEMAGDYLRSIQLKEKAASEVE